ncbi:DciA family protein [Breznakiellaceae bacterium SP9]
MSNFMNERFGPELVQKARKYAKLFSSWQEIVDAVDKFKQKRISAVAAHSRIVELEQYVLLVEADHPGWIQILQTKQEELLHAVQHRFPDLIIHGIAFKLSKNREQRIVPSNAVPSTVVEDKKEALPPPFFQDIDASLSIINDDKLKQILLNIRHDIILKESGKI